MLFLVILGLPVVSAQSSSSFTFNMADNTSSSDMIQQADSVWKMLNDLADSDPEGYKKFIDKTLKEGKEQFKPPQPFFCVSSVMLPEIITHKIYINVCGWDKIPRPKTDQDPIPVMAGPIEEIPNDELPYSIVDVIFNDTVLKDIEHKKDYRNLLIHLALDYLEETKKCTISKKYKSLKIIYKGNSSNLKRYLKTPMNGKFEDRASKSALIGESGTKDALLTQLSSIAISNADDKEIDSLNLLESHSKNVKKGLIEEISSTESNPLDVSKIKIPHYEVAIKDSEDGRPSQVVVTVELPGVTSVRDCELDVSEDDLSLEVHSLYKLELDLPLKINDSKVSATFNKASKRLTVKLPVDMK